MQLQNNNIAGIAYMINVRNFQYINCIQYYYMNFIFLDTAINLSETSTSTTTDPSSSSTKQFLPYVDFNEFYINVNKAKAEGNLPSNINFFYE